MSCPKKGGCCSLAASKTAQSESPTVLPMPTPCCSSTKKCSKFTDPVDRDEGFSAAEGMVEKCGVFGCISNGEWPTTLDVAHIICLGLVALQHRGQESAGIVTCKWSHEKFAIHRAMGLVSQVFNEPIMMSLKGNIGIGHTRYSTMGGSEGDMSQPFVVHTSYGTLAVAHNGELVNSSRLRQRILDNGVGLSTGSDTELITQALSMSPPPQFRQNYIDHRFHPLSRCESCDRHQIKSIRKLSITRPRAITNGESDDGLEGNKTSNDLNGDRKAHVSASISCEDRNETEEDDEFETNPYVGRLTQKDAEFVARILHLMSLTPLSYSLVIMYDECMYAVRDPFGNRPLCIGALLPQGATSDNLRSPTAHLSVDGWVVSSESCSFPSIFAKLFRDVEPGEIVKLERNKPPKTLAIVPRPDLEAPPAMCIFEYVYFARADSIIEGQMVYSVREKCGRTLAIEAPVEPMINKENYIVSAVPESAIPAALGFAKESGIPYVEVFSKNRYVGRSFIQPSMRLRRLAVAKKFGPLSQNFQGKSIILIDDSIVRGTTIGQLIRLLKDAGAVEVHIRIASPPLHFPCYMGINIPTKEELIANHMKADQLAQQLGAASLVYLSVEGLKKSVQSGIRGKLLKKKDYNDEELRERIGHCTACLTGAYPVRLDF